jgi:hypothetical protein
MPLEQFLVSVPGLLLYTSGNPRCVKWTKHHICCNILKMSESVIEIVGGETAGGKADMLIEHEALIRDVGLKIPPTTVIAGEALEPLKQELAADILLPTEKQSFPGSLLVRLCREYDYSPVLAVRSSAEGDAEGTGIYDSVFAGGDTSQMAQGIAQVVRSFHSPSAKEFRRRANLGDDFAIMVQPLVGQVLHDDGLSRFFAPPISGYGYSRSRHDLYGMINVVAGLGGGVDRPGGEQINYGSINVARNLAGRRHLYGNRDGLSFFDYVSTLRDAQKYYKLDERGVTDFRDPELLEREEALRVVAGMVLRLESQHAIYTPSSELLELGFNGIGSDMFVRPDASEKDDNPIVQATKSFYPGQLLDTFQRMQEIAGYPLYVEWALQLDDGAAHPLILQIAPFNESERGRFDAELPDDLVLTGTNVVGEGVTRASKIVYCANPRDITVLNSFNKDPDNAGYILVYTANLTTSQRTSGNMLEFADMSNAAVAIELASSIHGNSPAVDHIIGLHSKTGQIFAELDADSTDISGLLQLLCTGESVKAPDLDPHGVIRVLEGDFKVVADASHDKLYLGKEA